MHCQTGTRQWVNMFVQIKLAKYTENKSLRVFSWGERILIQCLSVIPPWFSTSNHSCRTGHGICLLRQSCKCSTPLSIPSFCVLEQLLIFTLTEGNGSDKTHPLHSSNVMLKSSSATACLCAF